MKRLCTICARGGSKGVNNKNIRLLDGKPLIAYSILQAKESGLFEYVAINSDSEKILEIADQYGADILIRRPDEMATDHYAKLPVIRYGVREVEKRTEVKFGTVVDLDATSPLRSLDDIHGAVTLLETSDAANVITGCNARRSPYFNLVEMDEAGIVRLSKFLTKAIVRRQDAPQCYDMNASIYVWNREILLSDAGLFQDKTRLFVMPEKRSIDIDSELDFELVEFLLKKDRGRS